METKTEQLRICITCGEHRSMVGQNKCFDCDSEEATDAYYHEQDIYENRTELFDFECD